MTSSTMLATPLGRRLLGFALLLAPLGLFETVEYLGSYSPLSILVPCLLVLLARRLGWLQPSLSMPARHPPFEDEGRRSGAVPHRLPAPIEPLMTTRSELLSDQDLAFGQAEPCRDLAPDRIEIERRKASWEWAFAKWSADLPSLLVTGYQLYIAVSFSFIIGTAMVIRLTRQNLLLSFLIAQAITLMAFYVFWRTRRRPRNRGWD